MGFIELLRRLGIACTFDKNGYILFVDKENECNMVAYMKSWSQKDGNKMITSMSDIKPGLICLESDKRSIQFRLDTINMENDDYYSYPVGSLSYGENRKDTLYIRCARYVEKISDEEVVEHTVETNSTPIYNCILSIYTDYRKNGKTYHHTGVQFKDNHCIMFDTESASGIFRGSFNLEWKMQPNEMSSIVESNRLISVFSDYYESEYPQIKKNLQTFNQRVRERGEVTVV